MAEKELNITELFALSTMEEILDILEDVEKKQWNLKAQYSRACDADLDYRILKENERKIRMAINKKVCF